LCNFNNQLNCNAVLYYVVSKRKREREKGKTVRDTLSFVILASLSSIPSFKLAHCRLDNNNKGIHSAQWVKIRQWPKALDQTKSIEHNRLRVQNNWQMSKVRSSFLSPLCTSLITMKWRRGEAQNEITEWW